MLDPITKKLPKSFFQQPTTDVARGLLGKVITHKTAEGTAAGRIVEVEAYLYREDPACHASKGKTARNAAMFGPAGTAYVYLIYGMYYCFNVVTALAGEGEAVLVRALEPLTGLELMAARRSTNDVRQLASGPGKLCQALAINRKQDGLDLTDSPLMLTDDGFLADNIITTTRIGISVAVDLPLRFYVAGNPYISRK